MDVNVLVRRQDLYPWREISEGLEAAGHKPVMTNALTSGIVTWNNYGEPARKAGRVKEKGGIHVVMENPYVFSPTSKQYLLSRNGYNGQGFIPAHEDDKGARWRRLGIQIHPWKEADPEGIILICAQRGGGYSRLAMRNEWPDEILSYLRTKTDRPIWYRPHPGKPRLPQQSYKNVRVVNFTEPLVSQLRQVTTTIVWTSFSALQSVLHGVPAFYCGPDFIGKALCGHGVENLDTPFYPDNRQSFFNDLAWHQWSLKEVQSGAAWNFILS